jgi:crossover junction endodeoxyribonuclease RusA
MAEMTPAAPTRLWQFHVPAPLEWRARKGTGKMTQAAKWHNANHHLTPFKRNTLTQEWRELGEVRARQNRLPKGIVSRVFVEAFIHMDTDRFYDAMNLYPTAKALVDGIVDYGFVADDSNKYVVGPVCLPGIKYERPGVTLRIHSLPAGGLYPRNYQPYKDRGKDLT